MLRIVVVIAMVGAITGMVGLLGFLPVAAQGSDPSATRSFNPATVDPGGEVEVRIAATGYGSLGAVTETLPAGFSYESSSLTGEGEVTEVDARTVRFTLQGANQTFTYTVTASSTAGDYDFSGALRDSDRGDHDVGGATRVTVEAPAAPQASATRSFNPATVDPGGEVVVRIAATGYGSLGAVTETLPAGFSYESSSLTDEGEVTEVDARTVRFTLQGADKTFTYTVTASSTAGDYDFSGVLRDSDRGDHDVGGATRVTVEAPAAPQASATRSFNPATVEPGGEVVVRIAATDYGSLGAVTETLPAGFSYESSSLTDEGEVTEVDARTVRFTLQGADKTFTYTVTASSVERSHTFSGVLRDSDRQDHTVGGASRVTVRQAAPPPPPPPPVPANRDPVFSDGSSTTRSIDENSADGANVGARVRATDADRDRLTYSLTGTDAGSFTINSSSGQIMVGTGTMLDYETKASYTVTVRATDPDNASDTITVNITVTNVDDMGEVTFWVGSVALTMPPQVDEAITGLVVDPDGGVMGETWQWAKSMDKTDMNSWMDIQGATDAMYTPMAADDGYYLQVTAMYEDAEGAGKTAMGMTGSAVGATGGALATYDADKNGSIDKSEYQAAAEHYLRGMIDKATFQEVAELYLRG